MWRCSLILNTLLLWVIALPCTIPLWALYTRFVLYPSAGGRALPAITALAFRVEWLLLVVPLFWTVGLILLLVRFRRQPPSPYLLQLHLSASLFVCLTLIAFFVLAVTMPYIEVFKGMRPG
ncbi:MAG TPA: hypothetical protein VGO11_04095 [Chthoniobacteraceae bacterium]|jgi:hypothetical protein|nr:hypothetical protein [Chthoniobacteraceae bacterium]